MSAQMDFFYFFGSTYSYLSIMRIDKMAAQAGIHVRWRPFYVRAIMIEQNNIPFRDKPVKRAYMWRDLERRANRFGIAWTGIPPYPVDKEGLANRIGIISAQEGWAPDYAKSAYRSWVVEHQDFGDPATAADILTHIGQDADRVIAHARSEEIGIAMERETDAARQLGIFGSPTFVIGREIFWGDDRLEEAIEWTQSHCA
jgi:2-hydroxychromene-2-carboxylate isomerase